MPPMTTKVRAATPISATGGNRLCDAPALERGLTRLVGCLEGVAGLGRVRSEDPAPADVVGLDEDEVRPREQLARSGDETARLAQACPLEGVADAPRSAKRGCSRRKVKYSPKAVSASAENS